MVADPSEPEQPGLGIEEVFQLEESPLLRFAFGLLGRREVAEEVVQDAFLALHQHWEEVRRPRPWLYRCVRNLSLNHLRKHKRETLSDNQDQDPSPREAPDEELARLESHGLVRLHLSELPPRDHSLLRMKYFEDHSYADIAEKLGMSVGNVGYRLHHLLRDLAASLRDAGIERSSP